ncbi:hypothetical protein NH340_JMT00720 [Sarcoptes scabiei]|nr:hypothetical protein NH340_JMT00720 [Sarcoptes scabiei]
MEPQLSTAISPTETDWTLTKDFVSFTILFKIGFAIKISNENIKILSSESNEKKYNEKERQNNYWEYISFCLKWKSQP